MLGCHPENVLYSRKYRVRGIINRVGAGKYGHVYVGCLKPSCKVPIIVKKSKDDMTKEYRIMKKAYSLVPKHVVQPYYFVKCRTGSIIYQEYFPQGTLSSNPKKITISAILQILTTLYILQKNGIKHNDVHLKNILVDGKRVVLTDFGLANMVEPGYSRNYGIGAKSNPGYDYHMFLNLVHELNIPRVSRVIERILPPEYLGFESPKVYNYRLRYSVDHSRLPSLASVIKMLTYNK